VEIWFEHCSLVSRVVVFVDPNISLLLKSGLQISSRVSISSVTHLRTQLVGIASVQSDVNEGSLAVNLPPAPLSVRVML